MEEKSLDQYKYESLCRQVREAYDFGNATDAEVMTGWHIVDVVEGEKTRRCLCGFDEIRTYYIVENRKIRHGICPIGSDCLRFFGMENLEAERIALWCIYGIHKAVAAKEIDIFHSPWDDIARYFKFYLRDTLYYPDQVLESLYKADRIKEDKRFGKHSFVVYKLMQDAYHDPYRSKYKNIMFRKMLNDDILKPYLYMRNQLLAIVQDH